MCGSGSGSRKLLNTDPIRIRSLIHNTGYHKKGGWGDKKQKKRRRKKVAKRKATKNHGFTDAGATKWVTGFFCHFEGWSEEEAE